MSSAVLQQAILAGQTITLPRGRIFNVLQASSPVSITLERHAGGGSNANPRIFNNIPAGSKYTGKIGEEWTYLRLTSAVNQTVTIFVGDDDMSFNNAVTVSGTAVVAVNPSVAITDQAGVVTLGTSQHALFPANLARRRITVYADPTNTATVFLRAAAGANDIGYIQPGTFEEFDTTAGLDYRDASAGGQKLYLLEES